MWNSQVIIMLLEGIRDTLYMTCLLYTSYDSEIVGGSGA